MLTNETIFRTNTSDNHTSVKTRCFERTVALNRAGRTAEGGPAEGGPAEDGPRSLRPDATSFFPCPSTTARNGFRFYNDISRLWSFQHLFSQHPPHAAPTLNPISNAFLWQTFPSSVWVRQLNLGYCRMESSFAPHCYCR